MVNLNGSSEWAGATGKIISLCLEFLQLIHSTNVNQMLTEKLSFFHMVVNMAEKHLKYHHSQVASVPQPDFIIKACDFVGRST